MGAITNPNFDAVGTAPRAARAAPSHELRCGCRAAHASIAQEMPRSIVLSGRAGTPEAGERSRDEASGR
jgi:hypothetical protein